MTLCSCLACYDGAPALLQYDWMARQKEDEEEETAWGGPADGKEREKLSVSGAPQGKLLASPVIVLALLVSLASQALSLLTCLLACGGWRTRGRVGALEVVKWRVSLALFGGDEGRKQAERRRNEAASDGQQGRGNVCGVLSLVVVWCECGDGVESEWEEGSALRCSEEVGGVGWCF